MPRFPKWLQTCANQLEGATNVNDVWSTALTMIQDQGFSWGLYGYTLHLRKERPFDNFLLLQHYPQNWIDHYIAEDYQTDGDWTIPHCRSRLDPCYFSPKQGETRARKLQVELIDIGLRSGVTFPLRGGSAGIGGFCLMSAMSPREFNDTFRENRHSIYLASLLVHEHMQRCSTQRTGAANPLSPREREVLLWSAHGHSSGTISDILDISEQTVNFHVAGAVKKLRASTRTHAVALAIASGIIKP